VLQATGERDPRPAHRHGREHHRTLHHERRRAREEQRGRGRGQRSHQQRAFAADDDEAELRGERRAERGEDERGGARQRVLPGEPGAERALIHVEIKIDRVLPEQRDEDAERDQCRRQRKRGDDDVFRRAADPLGERGAQDIEPACLAECGGRRRHDLGGLPSPLWGGAGGGGGS
jgi:hypothetical protein